MVSRVKSFTGGEPRTTMEIRSQHGHRPGKKKKRARVRGGLPSIARRENLPALLVGAGVVGLVVWVLVKNNKKGQDQRKRRCRGR